MITPSTTTNAGAEAKPDHLIAEISWQETCYYKCRRCKKWNMSLSYFGKDAISSCISDDEALTVSDEERKHIRNITPIRISPNTDHQDTPRLLYYCPGCYIRREHNMPTIVEFKTMEELVAHFKNCEKTERYREYKCNSCHFSSHRRDDIKTHQVTLQEKGSPFFGTKAHNGIDYYLKKQ